MSNPWECPRCHRINGPMMMYCSCPAKALYPIVTSTTGTFDTNENKWPFRCIECGKIHVGTEACITLCNNPVGSAE